MLFKNNEIEAIYKKTKSLLTNKRSKKAKLESIIKVSHLWQNLKNINDAKSGKQGLDFTQIDPKLLAILSTNEVNAVYNDLKETFKGSKKKSKKKKLLIFQNLINKNNKFLQLINILYKQAPPARRVRPRPSAQRRMKYVSSSDDDDDGDDDNLYYVEGMYDGLSKEEIKKKASKRIDKLHKKLKRLEEEGDQKKIEAHKRLAEKEANAVGKKIGIFIPEETPPPRTDPKRIKKRQFTDWEKMEEKENELDERDSESEPQKKKRRVRKTRKQYKTILKEIPERRKRSKIELDEESDWTQEQVTAGEESYYETVTDSGSETELISSIGSLESAPPPQTFEPSQSVDDIVSQPTGAVQDELSVPDIPVSQPQNQPIPAAQVASAPNMPILAPRRRQRRERATYSSSDDSGRETTTSRSAIGQRIRRNRRRGAQNVNYQESPLSNQNETSSGFHPSNERSSSDSE